MKYKSLFNEIGHVSIIFATSSFLLLHGLFISRCKFFKNFFYLNIGNETTIHNN